MRTRLSGLYVGRDGLPRRAILNIFPLFRHQTAGNLKGGTVLQSLPIAGLSCPEPHFQHALIYGLCERPSAWRHFAPEGTDRYSSPSPTWKDPNSPQEHNWTQGVPKLQPVFRLNFFFLYIYIFLYIFYMFFTYFLYLYIFFLFNTWVSAMVHISYTAREARCVSASAHHQHCCHLHFFLSKAFIAL